MRSIVPKQCVASTSTAAARLEGHAVCGPAVARTLAAVDDALDEPTGRGEARRPFWLTAPCPSWCDAASEPSGHHNHDAFEDRRHTLFGAEVELTLYPSAVETADVAAVQLPALSLMAAQHYLAAVPLVALTVPLASEPGGRYEEEVHLTVAEARALRDGLDELLAAVDATGGAR